MNRVIQEIQSRFADCEEFFWSPLVRETDAPAGECHENGGSVSGVKSPSGLDRGTFRISRRDSWNNVLVYFEGPDRLPSNGACTSGILIPGWRGGGSRFNVWGCNAKSDPRSPVWSGGQI